MSVQEGTWSNSSTELWESKRDPHYSTGIAGRVLRKKNTIGNGKFGSEKTHINS